MPSVNSALQRARATLAELPDHQRPESVDPENADLLAQYVDAFQRYDMTALLTVIREDAVMTMPPFELWIRGASDITTWMVAAGAERVRGVAAGAGAGQRRARLGAVQAGPGARRARALGAAGARGRAGDTFSRMTFFLDVERLFPLFGLADRIFDDR